jgi:hypothetical protein
LEAWNEFAFYSITVESSVYGMLPNARHELPAESSLSNTWFVVPSRRGRVRGQEYNIYMYIEDVVTAHDKGKRKPPLTK